MKLLSKAGVLLRLIRPELPLAAGMCVLLGQSIALGGVASPDRLALGFALGFLLSASAMVFNDLFDLEVDRVNAPERPFPSGLLTRGEGIGYGLTLGGLGLAVAASFGPLAFALGLLTWTLGFLYNWKLKAAGLVGNLIVAYSVAMTFLLGGVSVGQPWNVWVWVFAGMAFLFDLGEEIAGDAMDMQGDRLRGSRSLAIRWGKAAALRLSAALFAAMVGLTLFPAVWGGLGLAYTLPIAVTDAALLVFTARLLTSRTPQEGRAWMRRLYLSASLGLLAFLLASWMR